MTKYLVTGGAGFIGSHVVDSLVASGEQVRVVDNLSTGKAENLIRHDPSVIEFIKADLVDANVAADVVSGIDCVIHIAAIPSVPRSVRDPVASHLVNVDATLLLLEASKAARVNRFVFASSSSVYGDSSILPKHEQMFPNPLSPYALQKVIGEQYLRLFSSLYGLDTVALRFFNVFGPRQDPDSPYSGVISLFAAALSDGRPPIIYGDGEQTRDFTYVSDVVAAVVAASTAPNVSGKAINVACGGRVSVNELFNTLRDVLGVDVDPIYEPQRVGDVRDSQADNTLAKQLLGFRALVTVEEGLRRTVDWYRASLSRS